MAVFPPSRRGKCCLLFSLCVFCVWFGAFLPFFSVFLFLGSLFEKFSGSEFLFWGVGVGLVFFGGFLPMFLLYVLAVRSRNCLGKILLMSGLSGVSGDFSLFFWFLVDVVFVCFFFKRSSSGSNRTPLHAPVLFVPVLFFFVPPRLVCRPFWPCVLLLGVFLGVPFWAPRVFGILLELTGLELARPFRGPFLDARRQGCFCASIAWFLFFPPLFCGCALFLEGPPRDLAEASAGDLDPPPRPSEGQGMPYLGRRVGPLLFWDFVALLVYGRGSQGPSDAMRPGPFCRGGGVFLCPLRSHFSHARLFLPCPRFFFSFSRPSRPAYELESSVPTLDLQTKEFCTPRMECRIPRVVR